MIIERIKPIDNKLRYQLNKLYKLAALTEEQMADEENSHVDPMQFKPNISAMKQKIDEDHEGEEKPGIYKVAKESAVFYNDGFESKKDRDQRRKKELAKRSAIFDAIRAELTEAPEEESYADLSLESSLNKKEDKREREKREFEEDNFVRLPEKSRDQKIRQEKMLSQNPFNTKFDDYKDFAGFENEEADESESVARVIRDLERNAQRSKREAESGDLDLPYKNKDDKKKKREKMLADQYQKDAKRDAKAFDDYAEVQEEDDDYYKEVAAAVKKQKSEKEIKFKKP